jgi:hypothetical protein
MHLPRSVLVYALACVALFLSNRDAEGSVDIAGTTSMIASNPANRAAAVSGPIIFAVPLVQGFGIVNVGSSDSRDYDVTNAGDGDLVVTGVTITDPQFRSVTTLPLTIPRGETRKLRIEFAPTEVSERSVTISIQSNALNGTAQVVANGTANMADLWLSCSNFNYNKVLRFDWPSGGLLGETAEPNAGPGPIVFGPDGLLYVAYGQALRVLRFSPWTGAFVDVFVEGAAGRLAFGPDGNLYVLNGSVILRYDGATGASLGVFAPHDYDFGFSPISDMAFGPDGNLYVVDPINQDVVRFDGSTGDFQDVFVQGERVETGAPSTLAFGWDGDLYVGRRNFLPGGPPNGVLEIYRYSGSTGAFRDVFASAGTSAYHASDLEFGPEGDLYAVAIGSAGGVLRFSGATGELLAPFVPDGAGGLVGARAMAFSPGASRQFVLASVDLEPRTLNLKKSPGFVTAYIEVPGHDPSDVDLSSVRLADVAPEPKSVSQTDHDRDGIQELKVRFSQSALNASLSPGDIRLALTGKLTSGERFMGSGEIRVIQPGQTLLSVSVSPNPINPIARLRFLTTRPGSARILVHDIHGRTVRTLMDVPLVAEGFHEVVIDGRDDLGRPLASGVYLYRVVATEAVATGRFTILK